MLNQESAVKDMNKFSQITWDLNDWDLITAELRRRYPERNFKSYVTKPFTINEFEEAMEAVIPQGRQKSFDTFDDIRRDLFNAFKRSSPISAKLASVPSKAVPSKAVPYPTRWNHDEWDTVILELNRLKPQAFEERLAKLTLHDIHSSVAALPVDRRRTFKALQLFREHALKSWDEMPNEIKHPKRNVAEFTSGIIVEPVSKPSDKESAMATALHKAFQEPEKKVKKTKVFWRSSEWLDIAREMHRQNPHGGFFESTFAKIDLPAVRAAQRNVLPLERRKLLTGSAYLQAPLVEAFATLKREVEAEQVQAKLNPPAQTPFDIEDEETKLPEGFHAIPVLNSPPQSQMAEKGDFNTRLAQAATPLINLFVGELAKALAPELAKAFAPMVQTFMDGLKTAVTPTIVHQTIQTQAAPVQAPSALFLATPPNKEAVAAMFPAPAEKPKKPKIAVLGPFGKDRDMLERAFPDYRLVFIEHSHGIKEAGRDAVLFVCSYFAMTENNKGLIKSSIDKEKTRYVDGGANTIKRQIQMWIASQK